MSRVDLPPSVLWRNWQTEAHLVLRPKPGNSCGDFEAQITKPELPVWRPKPENPPPPWFWGSTKKPTANFEVKPGETVATSFEAKLEKTVATSFEVKPAKTVAAGFEAKSLETIAIGFEAQTDEKSSRRLFRRRKTARVNKRRESGKDKQNGKEELRKAQKSKKISKSTQKLKINTPP
jgi:hypothetical protein